MKDYKSIDDLINNMSSAEFIDLMIEMDAKLVQMRRSENPEAFDLAYTAKENQMSIYQKIKERENMQRLNQQPKSFS